MAYFPLSAARAQTQFALGLGFGFGFPSTSEIPSNSIPLLKVTLRCSPSSSNFRCKVSRRRLQTNQRLLFAVCATNPNSSGGKLPNEGSDVKEKSNASQGPPLLTILAGLVVFLFFCWVIGSIITWLISFIVNLPPK